MNSSQLSFFCLLFSLVCNLFATLLLITPLLHLFFICPLCLLSSLILPAQRLGVGAPAAAHHGFVVLVLLVLGQAGQRVALPESEQLVLGANTARRPVKGGAGVLRLAGKRIRVRGGWDVDAGPRAVKGQRASGSQCVFTSPRQVVL